MARSGAAAAGGGRRRLPPPKAPPVDRRSTRATAGRRPARSAPAACRRSRATLEIAQRLAATLPRPAFLPRRADARLRRLVSFDDRTSVANHEKADLFLSIHANSSRINGAHGSETYYLSLEASDKLAAGSRESRERRAAPRARHAGSRLRRPNRDLDFILWDLAQSAHLKESSELAEAIQEELNVVSGTENRGIKQAPFRVLVGATMPAVLVETAFISNPEEEKKLASPEFQQSVADAIATRRRAVLRARRPARPPALRRPAVTPPAHARPPR